MLIVVTITQKGPIIFFRLAEKFNGEYDGIISSPFDRVKDWNDYMQDGQYLNFTKAQEITNSQYNLSPRMQQCATYIPEFEPNYACVMQMDTEREKQIMLGPNYPYEPLQAGECIVNAGILEYNPEIQVGSTITIEYGLTNLIEAMATVFNEQYLAPKTQPVKVHNFTDSTPCVVKAIMSEPYGKFPSTDQAF